MTSDSSRIDQACDMRWHSGELYDEVCHGRGWLLLILEESGDNKQHVW